MQTFIQERPSSSTNLLNSFTVKLFSALHCKKLKKFLKDKSLSKDGITHL